MRMPSLLALSLAIVAAPQVHAQAVDCLLYTAFGYRTSNTGSDDFAVVAFALDRIFQTGIEKP
jgi:hypothetical protein